MMVASTATFQLQPLVYQMERRALHKVLDQSMRADGLRGVNRFREHMRRHFQLSRALDAATFKEAEHPRVKNGPHAGEFGSKGGGQTSGQGGFGTGKSQALIAASENRKKWPPHIQKLVIPPAWTDVRVNPDPKGDLLAVGKDIKGRSQYIYSERFREGQAAQKFARAKEMEKRFDEIKNQNAKDLASKDPQRRENAECCRLIMAMGIRPGSETNTKAAVQAYGATTLQARHVRERRGKVYLAFVGKKGVSIDLPVEDPDVARSLLNRSRKASKPSEQIFPDVTDKSLLAYTHSLDGGKFKSKDLRTRFANAEASRVMQDMKPPATEKEYKKRVKEVATLVSEKLGNTPTICLQSYLSPEIFSGWRSNVTP